MIPDGNLVTEVLKLGLSYIVPPNCAAIYYFRSNRKKVFLFQILILDIYGDTKHVCCRVSLLLCALLCYSLINKYTVRNFSFNLHPSICSRKIDKMRYSYRYLWYRTSGSRTKPYFRYSVLCHASGSIVLYYLSIRIPRQRYFISPYNCCK